MMIFFLNSKSRHLPMNCFIFLSARSEVSVFLPCGEQGHPRNGDGESEDFEERMKWMTGKKMLQMRPPDIFSLNSFNSSWNWSYSTLPFPFESAKRESLHRTIHPSIHPSSKPLFLHLLLSKRSPFSKTVFSTFTLR